MRDATGQEAKDDTGPPPSYSFVESELRVDSAQMRHTLPQFIDALTDAVIMVDRHRRVVAANRRYMEVFGAVEPRVVGSICQETLNCPDSDGLAGGGHCAACQVIDYKEPRKVLRNVTDKDGQIRR